MKYGDYLKDQKKSNRISLDSLFINVVTLIGILCLSFMMPHSNDNLNQWHHSNPSFWTKVALVCLFCGLCLSLMAFLFLRKNNSKKNAIHEHAEQIIAIRASEYNDYLNLNSLLSSFASFLKFRRMSVILTLILLSALGLYFCFFIYVICGVQMDLIVKGLILHAILGLPILVGIYKGNQGTAMFLEKGIQLSEMETITYDSILKQKCYRTQRNTHIFELKTAKSYVMIEIDDKDMHKIQPDMLLTCLSDMNLEALSD